MYLRTYQQEAVTSALEDLHKHDSLGIIAPTGAGKTVMMQAICEDLLRELGTGYNIIIVSHLSVLQGQTLDFFIRTCKYKTTKYQGKKLPSVNTRVIITTMQSLRREGSRSFFKRRLLNNKTALIMIDEAQMYGANSYDMITEEFATAKVIGFSASPYRGNQYSFNQFDKVSYSISLEQLIDEGYLVEPRLHTIDLKGMSIAERTAHVAGIYSSQLSPKGALVYWNTKEQADTANAVFNMSGLKSAVITDDTPDETKVQILDRFEKGEVTVIHNVNILSAGYDSNKVYGIFMPMGTSSPVNYIQRVGRGLRKERGKTHCKVYIYGDAPSIKRGLYTKMNRVALRTKDDPEYGKRGDVYEQLDWMEATETPDPIKLKITRDVVSACEKIKELDLDNLHRLIRFKRFPKRYLRSLVTAQARVDEELKGKASDSQSRFLISKGFEDTDIATLNQKEAQALIGMIQHTLNQEWVVQSGLHANKHISEVPLAYIGALVKMKRRNPILNMYGKWKREGKPMP